MTEGLSYVTKHTVRHTKTQTTDLHWNTTNIIIIIFGFVQFKTALSIPHSRRCKIDGQVCANCILYISGVFWCVGQADSSLSESEDENPEALRPLSHYSLCEQPQSDLLLILPSTPPPSPRLLHSSQAVVISQPAPLCSPHQPSEDTHPHAHSSESVSLHLVLIALYFFRTKDLFLQVQVATF